MPAGIQIFNDSGVLQIDETYINYVLISKGTATTNQSSPNYSWSSRPVYYVEITATGRTAPMIALKASQGAEVFVVNGSVSSGTWKWRIVGGANNVSFDYYIFDVAPVSTDTFGVAIYNAAGDPVFHSSQKPLRVGGVFESEGTILPYGTSFNQSDFGAGRTWAGVQLASGNGENEIEEGDDTRYAWWEGVFTHANGLGVGGIYTRLVSGSGDGVVSPWNLSKWLAVDVTNY
jgi:hypothetical protein